MGSTISLSKQPSLSHNNPDGTAVGSVLVTGYAPSASEQTNV
jgi:hypothetical protein